MISLYFSFLSELGDGYVPAVINSATEFKFINRISVEGGRRSFFIGGSTNAAREGGINRFIDFFEYLQSSTGKTMTNYMISCYSTSGNVFKMLTFSYLL